VQRADAVLQAGIDLAVEPLGKGREREQEDDAREDQEVEKDFQKRYND
jgi:hypothetical protein